MMTPIHKIPQMDSEKSLARIVEGELRTSGGIENVQGELLKLIDHDGNEESFSCMMDWAMQIRNHLGISWAESIYAASILFYG